MSMRAERVMRPLLLLPALALVVLVVVIPAIQAAVLAFSSEASGFTLDNVSRVFADAALGEAVRNTLVLIVVLLPIQALVALAIAAGLDARFRGSPFALHLVVLPLAVSDLAAGLLWLAVFTDRGYLNSALQSAGIIAQPLSWLAFDNFGGMLAAIVVAETWRTTGVIALPLLAGSRQSSSETPGSLVRRLRAGLAPALLLRAILALQTFAVVFALVGRNVPLLEGATYTQLVANRDERLAAGYVVVIVALAALASVAYLRFARTRVPVDR